ncbi:MAG: hypothetical protein ACE5JU_11175 [Candidatus Binatia bacterium]
MTEDFFSVLGGRRRIEIEGKQYGLNSQLRLLEFFSWGRHETVFLEQGCECKAR